MLKNVINRFASDESGATAIEYGLIASLIAVAIIAIGVAMIDVTGIVMTAATIAHAQASTSISGHLRRVMHLHRAVPTACRALM